MDYDPHQIDDQSMLIEPRPEPGQDGVHGLLQGRRMFIEPEGFSDVRARGGSEHRLRSGDIAQKWQPLGVGAMEGDPMSVPPKLANPLPKLDDDEILESE
jgi:lysine 2,3-aminomutase